MSDLYRKKPVVIEAKRVGVPGIERVSEWCGGIIIRNDGPVHVLIYTLEGVMRADIGDWIIKGVKGEFYPCKPDIFDQTYEPLGADDE